MRPVAEQNKAMMNYQEFVNSIENFTAQYQEDIDESRYFSFPLKAVLNIENQLLSKDVKSVAYFSMEYGIAPSIYNTFQRKQPMSDLNKFFQHEIFSNYWMCDYLFRVQIDKMLDIPIYGGGLGVLAGDTMKSSSDHGLPIVGIGILWNKGYFKQKFWYKHGQVPEEQKWDPHTYPGLIPLKNRVVLDTNEGPLTLRLWKYYVYSFKKEYACPIILLDSNLEQNPPHFRKLTDQLYRSDNVWWKIFQRTILGVGGMKALRSLNYNIDVYHLNEGHAAFAILEKYLGLADKADTKDLKEQFVFTCHTPVAAGHDRFRIEDAAKILKPDYLHAAEMFGKEDSSSSQISLTFMALNNCNKINAVAKKHGEIMRLQFPNFAGKVGSITNGVHLHTWISDSFQNLFDKYKKTFGDWRGNPDLLLKAEELRKNDDFRRDLFEAHLINKSYLLNVVRHWKLDEKVFTLGWARRIAGYKRPALIFHNIDRIIQLADSIGPLQIILAGKAHPNDNIGGAHIDEILDHIGQLNQYKDRIKVLILENYDTYFGKLLSNSVDVWLNNPLPPFEASGTSGMKAILNGVLQLTTLDGWVVEAAEDNIGWLFGYQHKGSEIGNERELRLDEDSHALYTRLEEVMQLYYQTHSKKGINLQSEWIDKMINCIKTSVFFNTQRMVKEYNDHMWHLEKPS